MEERGFNELINGIESDPLFKKLMKSGIVQYHRRSNWGLASDFLQFDDDIFHSTTTDSDISEVIENNRDIIPVIRNMGIERFKSLFLNNERLNENEIASDIDVDVPTVKRIVKLMNDVSVLSEFFHPSGISQPRIAYVKIAKIDIDRGRLVCGYYSPNIARGKYLIDNEKLKLFQTGVNRDDNKRLAQLMSAIHLINSRKSIVHNIVSSLTKLQCQYFVTGEPCKLKVLTAKDLSLQSNISRSSISRAIFRKSIVTPQNVEIPVRVLLPHRKDIVKYILRDIFNRRGRYTDEQIRRELSIKHNISVSRRLVCLCRNEDNLK